MRRDEATEATLLTAVRYPLGAPITKGTAVVAVVLMTVLGGGPSICWDCRAPQAATEIFRGVTYGAERLEPSSEGRGLLHWARIDLSAPGIELYVTPLDPAAVAEGWQYRLRWIADVVRSERLVRSPSTERCSPRGSHRHYECLEISPGA